MKLAEKVDGRLLVLGASLCWSTGGLFLKYINCSPFVTAGFRSIFAFVFLCLLTWKLPQFYIKDSEGHVDRKNTLDFWAGGISYAATALLYICANKLTTAANAILLQYTDIIWVIFLGRIILGEKIQKIDIIVVAGVILGMLLFFADELSAGLENIDTRSLTGDVLAILAGVAMCLATIFLRKLDADNSIQSYKLSTIILAVFCLPFIFIYGVPDWKTLLLLVLVSLVTVAVPGIFYTSGVQTVSALSALLLSMAEPLMNPVWVMIFFHEVPSWMCITGGLIILGFIILREIVMYRKNKSA